MVNIDKSDIVVLKKPSHSRSQTYLSIRAKETTSLQKDINYWYRATIKVVLLSSKIYTSRMSTIGKNDD